MVDRFTLHSIWILKVVGQSFGPILSVPRQVHIWIYLITFRDKRVCCKICLCIFKYFTFSLLKKLKTAYTYLYILCGVFFVLSFPYFCGFGRGGVRGGSAAAGTQSLLGDVEKGSVFACCQCIGTVFCLGTGLTVFLFIACGISSLVTFLVYLILGEIYKVHV